MKISSSVAGIVGTVLVLATGCEAQDQSAPRLDRVADELSSDHACILMTLALHELGKSDSTRTGLSPLDSAEVRAASVDIISQRDESGRAIETWWVVTLRMPSKPYNGEVRVRTRDGTAAVRRVHKSLDS